MKEAFCKFISQQGLSPFSSNKTSLTSSSASIYKTRDGKTTHNRLLTKISSEFNFSETSNLWHGVPFTTNLEIIKQRQVFFQQITGNIETSFLKDLKVPRTNWSPKYDVIAVTEEEETFIQLNELGCTTKLLISDQDLTELERYDIVQVIDCNDFQRSLETLPQTVFIQDIEDVYLERYLEKLSGWKESIELLKQHVNSGEISRLSEELVTLFPFFEEKSSKIITKEEVNETLEEMNIVLEEKLKDVTISGGSLMKIMSEGKLPEDFQKVINDIIEESKIPPHIFNVAIPVTVDEKELDDLIRRQSANEFTDLAEEVKAKSDLIKSIPDKLDRLSQLLIVLDFLGGISKYLAKTTSFPQEGEELILENSKNYFLDEAQPISFSLNNQNKCSILTGANSGGKTTLLEHVIQSISLFQLGLPINGSFKTPLFTEVYYFAKNKGAANKGAFENLLTQMSTIKPGAQTLILADEIEAVTEPGVAGKIIASTANYFLNKGCFLIVATHLGHEIKEVLPAGARIDGIEAKGLDDQFNLIVDHNPVLGRLAHSTPELIVERMANSNDLEYFRHLHESLKKD